MMMLANAYSGAVKEPFDSQSLQISSNECQAMLTETWFKKMDINLSGVANL